MKEPKLIPCHGGKPHAKLPCIVCGNHAGGCLYPLTPESACAGCKGPVCVDCAFRLRERPAPRCPRCEATAAVKRGLPTFVAGFFAGAAAATALQFVLGAL